MTEGNHCANAMANTPQPALVSSGRRSGKDKNTGVKKTLDVHHTVRVTQLNNALDELVERQQDLKNTTQEVRNLQAEYQESKSDTTIERIIQLQDHAIQLQKQITSLQLNSNELSYLLDTGEILFKYYDIVENGTLQTPTEAQSQQVKTSKDSQKDRPSILAWFQGSANVLPQNAETQHSEIQSQKPVSEPTDTKVTLFEKYMAATHGRIHNTTNESSCKGEVVAKDIIGVCKHCHSYNMTVLANEGYMYCNDCSTIEYIVMDHDKPSYKDPPKEISYWAYKRINHFNEWLNQTQARQSTEIPEELYDRILLEIKKQRITNMAELTPAKVKEILKKLKGDARKYYEHIPFIIHRLNGKPMPHFPPELEEQLRSMFRAIQVPFSRSVLVVCPSRKNFLSYSFVLHKFMQLLGLDEYVHIFQLLRSREKLHQQDQIWRLICEELGWEFVPSI